MKTCALIVSLWCTLWACSSPAYAMELALQDQGADEATLSRVAGDLGVATIRVIASPAHPQLDLIRSYRASGFRVQVAILLKRQDSAGDVRGLMRKWQGAVGTVSIGNEPELNGLTPCHYASLYSSTRRMIKHEFSGVKIGFGEFSPAQPLDYLQRALKCGTRLRADFAAIHPYQFFSDPMGSPSERSGVGTWVGLGNLWRFRRELRGMGSPPIRCTEFSYLVTGKYKIPVARAASYWPRAIIQARRYCQQLVIFGLGCVGDNSNWGSAALLSCTGVGTSALERIANTLGRSLQVYPSTGVDDRADDDLLPGGPDQAEGQSPPLVAHAASPDPPQEVVNDSPAVDPVPSPVPEPVSDPIVPPPSVDETPTPSSPPLETMDPSDGTL